MPALPLELCLEVFERSHFSKSNLFPDYPTLRNLSLVCRAFGYHAQRALFRNVVLKRPSQARAFVQATDPIDERGRFLGAAVRSLTVRVEELGSKVDIDCRTFVSVFLRCPDLVELVLRTTLPVRGGWPFSGDEVNLKTLAPRSLRCINSRQSPFGYWLINLYPWITGLSLGCGLEEVIARNKRNAKLCTDNLVELQWFDSIDQLIHLLGVEDGPSETRRHSIEILGLRDAGVRMNWKLGPSVLRNLGPGLRSLHLHACDPAYVATIRQHVQALEELILDVLPSQALLDALPPTIQHLQIRSRGQIFCTKDLEMGNLLDWIPTAGNLKVLTWAVWGCSGHGLYESIDALCKEMGVHLRLYTEGFGVFKGEVEPLAYGHVKSFPRPMTFSPMRKGIQKMSYDVKEFVAGLAHHPLPQETVNTSPQIIPQSAPPTRYPKKSRYVVPNSRPASSASKTPKFLNPSSLTNSFVPQAASSAFTFSSLQAALPEPSGSSGPSSTAPSTFKFSFGAKPSS
ncbi:hypothetical protein FRC02_009006 [Tulasnella sp. 418]|nr:hypothetical protein FRC02_009006 [Tulasnella sp. 418]